MTTATRPSVAETMFALAEATARRSTCPAGAVGAVLAHGDTVLAIGYNGAPRGLPHCDEAGCVVIPAGITVEDGWYTRLLTREYSRHVHAELNAIIQCARDGRSTVGATCYVTTPPCLDCAKALIQAGIRTLVLNRDPGADWLATVGEFLEKGSVFVSGPHLRP